MVEEVPNLFRVSGSFFFFACFTELRIRSRLFRQLPFSLSAFCSSALLWKGDVVSQRSGKKGGGDKSPNSSLGARRRRRRRRRGGGAEGNTLRTERKSPVFTLSATFSQYGLLVSGRFGRLPAKQEAALNIVISFLFFKGHETNPEYQVFESISPLKS